MRLIFIRHCETVANLEKRYLGWSSSPYTRLGYKQIRDLIEIIGSEQVDVILSSPLSRALTLAEALGRVFEREVEVQDALKEMNFGIFEGKTYKEVAERYPVEWEEWSMDYRNYRLPQGERFIDFHSRVTGYLDSLRDPRTYILVTHGGVIQSAITHLLNLDMDARWRFKIPPGSILEIIKRDDYAYLTRLIPGRD
jgi:alpha-ribazole phosphatase